MIFKKVVGFKTIRTFTFIYINLIYHVLKLLTKNEIFSLNKLKCAIIDYFHNLQGFRYHKNE